MLGGGAVADDETRSVGHRGVEGGAEGTDGDLAGQEAVDHRLLRAAVQVEDHVEPGGDARRCQVGDGVGQRGQEVVPAAAVAEPGPAELAVVGPRVDQLGQGQLFQHRGVAVGEVLDLPQLVPERAGDGHPGQAQSGGQALGRRAHVDHVLGVEGLQGAHGLAVIAQLAVVVVLYDQAPGGPGPGHGRGPPVRRQGGSRRVLVGRGEHDGAHPAQVVEAGSVLVDRQRHHGEPGPPYGGPVVGNARVLHADGGDTPGPEHPAGEVEGLAPPRAGHQVVGVGDHAPHPAEVGGQGRAQPWVPARVAVAQVGVGHRAQDLAQRGGPRATGEAGEVGAAGLEVVTGPGWEGGHHGSGLLAPGALRHGGGRALPGDQPALGGQLGVGVGHRAPGESEVGGQGPGGGQAVAPHQAAVPDGLPDGSFEGGPATVGPAELDVEVDRTGPGCLHGNRPYRWTSSGVGSFP